MIINKSLSFKRPPYESGRIWTTKDIRGIGMGFHRTGSNLPSFGKRIYEWRKPAEPTLPQWIVEAKERYHRGEYATFDDAIRAGLVDLDQPESL